MAAGDTAYYCQKCKRPLAHTDKRKDTVSVNQVALPFAWTHDQCKGGKVLLRVPEKAA